MISSKKVIQKISTFFINDLKICGVDFIFQIKQVRIKKK